MPDDDPARWTPRGRTLPAELSSFVGRAREVEALTRLLATPGGGSDQPRPRLVTLAGPGGIGKTRLALRVAAAAQAGFVDGVWLVELAALADEALVPHAAAAALGIVHASGRPPPEALAEVLADRRALLVLDNCEHLVAACAALSTHLLRECPDICLLATSREPLGVEGEVVWRVAPLALPAAEGAPAAESDAVRLLVERAGAAQPGLALTEDHTAAMTAICRRLDGIPLAIELAAARLKVLSPEQVLDRLEDRFRLLSAGRRASVPRQHTLRATIDWSYELLAPPERALFAWLSVFRGGCALDAAEAVCAAGTVASTPGPQPLCPGDVLDLLARLVDKSLVLTEGVGQGDARYRLLETLRAYGWERLEAGGEAAAARSAHAAYYLALAERAEPELHGPQQAAWLRRLEQEHDNLRAALDWLCAGRDAARALRLGSALAWFWEVRGRFSEARERLAALRFLADTTPGCDPALRARVLSAVARFAMLEDRGREAWAGAAMESLALCRALGDRRGEARALFHFGQFAAMVGLRAGDDHPDIAALDSSAALARSAGDEWQVAWSLNTLGVVVRNRGDLDRARALLEDALARRQRLRDARGIATSLSDLGHLERALGDDAAARRRYEESLALRRDLGDVWGLTHSLRSLGEIALAAGDLEQARQYLEEGVAVARRAGLVGPAAVGEHFLALVACEAGHSRRAIRCALTVEPDEPRRRSAPVPTGAAAAGGRAPAGNGRGAAIAAKGGSGASKNDRAGGLSPREAEVAALIARGLTNRQIAAELIISRSTAARHVENILGKLGLRNRAQITAWAVERTLPSNYPS